MNLQEQISQAKSAGYSDADIAVHLSGSPEYGEKVKQAAQAGYKPEEIITHLTAIKAKPTYWEHVKNEARANPYVRAAIGAGQAVQGVAGLGMNAGDWVAEKLGLDPVLGKAWAAKMMETTDETSRALKATGRTDVDIAGMVGGAAVPLTGAKLAPTFMGKVGQGMKVGAFAGATAPGSETIGENARGGVMGGTIGGVIPGAAVPAAKVGKGVWNFLAPFFDGGAGVKGEAYLSAAGTNPNQVVNWLRQNQQIVPGSRPTAGEAATGAGVAEFSAIQRQAADVLPTQYLARADEQNAARLNHLRLFAKDENALNQQGQVRSANAAANYGAAEAQAPVVADAVLEELMSRPDMKKAIARAATIAGDKGEAFKIGGSPAKVVNTPQGPIQVRAAVPAQYPVKNLHNIKTALDDMVRDPATFGIGASEAKAIRGMQQEYLTWLENKVPDYRQARTQFKADSVPMNQMQIGQYLEEKLVPALSDEGKQRSGMFANAVRDAAGTIKRGTDGAARYQKLTQALEPSQVRIVDEIMGDLARSDRQALMAQKGSKAVEDITGMASASAESSAGGKIPNVLNRTAMIANAIVTRLEGKINKKLALEIAQEMLDPDKVADIMEKAIARQGIRGAAGHVAKNTLLPLSAISAQGQQRNQLRELNR